MSERVELELLRRLEAMTVERDKEREALRAAEKRELEALAELDEERANIETLKTHVETLREAWQGASEAVTKLVEQLNASEADCERFYKLLDDCDDLLSNPYDPDDNLTMMHRIQMAQANYQLYGQKAERLRAFGELLRAVEAYRKANK